MSDKHKQALRIGVPALLITICVVVLIGHLAPWRSEFVVQVSGFILGATFGKIFIQWYKGLEDE